MSADVTTIGSKPGRDKPKCEAKRRGGDGLCQRPAGWGTDHPGIGRCKLHGGSTHDHRKNALKVQAQRDVTAFGARTDITAPEALLELVQSKAAEVAYWDGRVSELGDDERAGMLDAKVEDGFEKGEAKLIRTTQAGPHVFVVMLHKAQDQLAAYSAAAIRAGVDRAMVEAVTLQAAWLLPLLYEAITAARANAEEPAVIIRGIVERQTA